MAEAAVSGVHAKLAQTVSRRVAIAILVTQLVAAGVILARSLGWLQPLELAAYDRLLVAWSGHEASDRVALVGISEADYHRWPYPLPDGDLADLLQRIEQAQPRVIGVDLVRDMPVPPGTERLAEVLARYPNIVWIFRLKKEGDPGTPPPQPLRDTDRAVLADIPADPGNIIRRGLLYADDGVENYASLGMALAAMYLAGDGIAVEVDADRLRLGSRRFALLSSRRGPYVELDSGGYQLLLDYHGGAAPFRQLGMADVIDRPAAAAELVRGRAVIIGNTAETVPDTFPTPFDADMTHSNLLRGIEIHAHIADQLIRWGKGISTQLAALPRTGEMAWIWAWAVLGGVLGLQLRSTKWAFLGLLGGVVGLGAIVYEGFGLGLLLPGPPAGLAWIGAAALTNWASHAETHRERQHLRDTFELFTDPSVIENALRSGTPPRVGGERREVSVLFTDVADFTTLSETMDPVLLAELVTAYFEGLCAAVAAEGGIVLEFIGDAILALFGPVEKQPDHADRAVAAALAIDAFASEFGAWQRSRGVGFGATRIGVHCGSAMVGIVGAHNRMKFGALGDVLNTGSRLEGLNKVIGTRICVSGEVAERCRRHRFRSVGSFVVKGRHTAIEVFEPVDGRFRSPERLAGYQAAFDALRGSQPDALAQFSALNSEDPADALVAFHRHRLEAGESGSLIVMTEK